MQECSSTTGVTDDEDRPVDGLLAVSGEQDPIQAHGGRGDRQPQLQSRECAEGAQPEPEGFVDRAVQISVVAHSAFPLSGGGGNGEARRGTCDHDLVAGLHAALFEALIESQRP